MTKLYIVTTLLALCLPFSELAVGQDRTGRVSLGFRGGVNMWVNDMNERKVGPGGELFFRYAFSPMFSMGVTGGYEELKASQNILFVTGLPEPYLKLQAFPASLLFWFHLFPESRVSPFIYFGGGGMIYKRRTGVDGYYPNKSFQTTLHVPAGIGFETFVSKNVALSFDFGLRFMDDHTEKFKFKFPDYYGTVKSGLNFYLGRADSHDDDDDGLSNGDESTAGTDPDSPDSDGDGLKDGEEVHRYLTNPLHTDSDGDRLSDGDEVFIYKTDPRMVDTDGDGLRDGDEILVYHSDPLKLDTDGDGLSDGEEIARYKTDPLKADTDGDGLTDLDETRIYRTDPLKTDSDNDGLIDGEEVKVHKSNPMRADTDGGGTNDGDEIKRGTNPLDPRDDQQMILEKGKSVILEGVTFESSSALITRQSEATLERVYNALVASPEIRVEISGHSDNVGSAESNRRLSLRRAEAVKNWLMNRGISSRRMSTIGKGISEPIAPNDTPEGRAKNRRIEFHILK